MSRPPSADDEKKARLAAALRENLKRRKAQARARRVDGPVSRQEDLRQDDLRQDNLRQDEPSDAQAETTRS